MGARGGHFHAPAQLLTHESDLCPQSRAFCKGAGGELGGKSSVATLLLPLLSSYWRGPKVALSPI